MQIVGCLPILFWLIFRIVRPVISIKELKEGDVHFDPGSMVFFMFSECISYCLVVFFFCPFRLPAVSIYLWIIWSVSLFLALWVLGHVVYFLILSKKSKSC